jgi:hypothetical protein
MLAKDRYLLEKNLDRDIPDFISFGKFFCFATKIVDGYTFFIGTTSKEVSVFNGYQLIRCDLEHYCKYKIEIQDMISNKVSSHHSTDNKFEAWVLVSQLK